MFEKCEVELGPTEALRVPVLDGKHHGGRFSGNNLMQVRVERPHLSKDVLEYRSAQAQSLDLTGCIFDENHNLIGRRVPFTSNMEEIPEENEEEVDPSSGSYAPAGFPSDVGS